MKPAKKKKLRLEKGREDRRLNVLINRLIEEDERRCIQEIVDSFWREYYMERKSGNRGPFLV